jgi:ubiquitin-conjugating enzyme E2 S
MSYQSKPLHSFNFPLFPEGTPFVGGHFKVKLVLSDEYPNAPPRGFFLTKIYHPNVSASGDICVNTLKKDWTPEVTIKHVLQVIRCLLIVPFPESSLNDEAGNVAPPLLRQQK